MKILYLTHGIINQEEKRNFYDTLVEMGHDVEYLNYVKIMDDYGKQYLNYFIVHRAEIFKPDLVFSILYEDQIEYETFGTLRKLGFKVMNLFCDDHWRYNASGYIGTRSWLPYLDYAITVFDKAVDWYKADGFNGVILSQWGANPKHYKPLDLPKKYDVTFIGQKYGDRGTLIDKLCSVGINAKAFGRGFTDDKPLEFHDYLRIVSQSKININTSECSSKQGTQMKARSFEIPCCKGFLLNEKYYELDKFFTPKEMVQWNGFDDLVGKIRYFLSHDKERKEIAERAYKRILKEHTYVHRFEKIFNEMSF